MEKLLTKSQHTEDIMLDAFKIRASEILAAEEAYHKVDPTVKIGLEVEYSLVDNRFDQAPETVRNTVVAENPDFIDAEMGAAQIELRTDPIDALDNAGFGAIHESLVKRQRLLNHAATKNSTILLASGSNPFVPITDIARSDKLKYQLVPNFHNVNHNGCSTILGDEGLDVGDAAIVGILNSVQANIEAAGFCDAIDKLNRSFMIGPMAVALTANARFLDLKDSCVDDVRMIAWELSHETRTNEEINIGIAPRAGIPSRYYYDVGDYLDQVMSYPFILNVPDKAMEVGIGLNWRDARIKFVEDSTVVEFRPVSTQPTPEGNSAAMAFYVGRLLWSQINKEGLLPIEKVRDNRDSAMTVGSRALLWTSTDTGKIVRASAQEVLPLEIEKAVSGLEASGTPDVELVRELMFELNQNLVTGTPSSKLNAFVKTSVENRKEAIIDGLAKLGSIG